MSDDTAVGQRVRHATTGERGTVRELLPGDCAYVDWDAGQAGVARRHHLLDATPVPQAKGTMR